MGNHAKASSRPECLSTKRRKSTIHAFNQWWVIELNVVYHYGPHKNLRRTVLGVPLRDRIKNKMISIRTKVMEKAQRISKLKWQDIWRDNRKKLTHFDKQNSIRYTGGYTTYKSKWSHFKLFSNTNCLQFIVSYFSRLKNKTNMFRAKLMTYSNLHFRKSIAA